MADHSDEVTHTVNTDKAKARMTESGAFTLRGKYDHKSVPIFHLNFVI